MKKILQNIISIQLSICLIMTGVLGYFAIKPTQAHATPFVILGATVSPEAMGIFATAILGAYSYCISGTPKTSSNAGYSQVERVGDRVRDWIDQGLADAEVWANEVAELERMYKSNKPSGEDPDPGPEVTPDIITGVLLQIVNHFLSIDDGMRDMDLSALEPVDENGKYNHEAFLLEDMMNYLIEESIVIDAFYPNEVEEYRRMEDGTYRGIKEVPLVRTEWEPNYPYNPYFSSYWMFRSASWFTDPYMTTSWTRWEDEYDDYVEYWYDVYQVAKSGTDAIYYCRQVNEYERSKSDPLPIEDLEIKLSSHLIKDTSKFSIYAYAWDFKLQSDDPGYLVYGTAGQPLTRTQIQSQSTNTVICNKSPKTAPQYEWNPSIKYDSVSEFSSLLETIWESITMDNIGLAQPFSDTPEVLSPSRGTRVVSTNAKTDGEFVKKPGVLTYPPAAPSYYPDNWGEVIKDMQVIIVPETYPNKVPVKSPAYQPAPRPDPTPEPSLDPQPQPTINKTTIEEVVNPKPKPQEPEPDPTPITLEGSLEDLKNDISGKFPFCIPFDIYKTMSLLSASPQTPQFQWDFNVMGQHYYYQVDLSPFDGVASILRHMTTILFLLGVIYLSITLVRMMTDVGKD